LIDNKPVLDIPFKMEVVNKIFDKLKLCVSKQQYMEAVIPSNMGYIKLYGIADFEYPEMLTDLKTTEHYSCNKYKDYCQCPVYSLIRKVNGKPIKAFKYLVTDFNKVYQETYIPTEHMHLKLMNLLYEFINFIEYFKNHINNQKIFGGK